MEGKLEERESRKIALSRDLNAQLPEADKKKRSD